MHEYEDIEEQQYPPEIDSPGPLRPMELEADESFGPVVRIQTASPPPESAPNSPARHIDPAFLSPPPAFQKRKRPRRPSTTSATPIILSFEVDQEPDPPKPKRPSVFCASSKEGTEVLVPPPPLCEPTSYAFSTRIDLGFQFVRLRFGEIPRGPESLAHHTLLDHTSFDGQPLLPQVSPLTGPSQTCLLSVWNPESV